MADNKKYYYLKLKDSFFDEEKMIVLESLEDGYIYSNIYMKLLLRSLKADGRLMFNDRIPYNSTLLAQITRHSVGDVERAIKILGEFDLIEIMDNGAIYMLDIQNFIGCSSTEADRQREYQRKVKSANGNDQLLLECKKSNNEPNKESNKKTTPEIEIEKELKTEIDKEKDTEIHKQIISILNQVSGRHFRLTESTKKFINGRLKEGFTLADFESVIKHKTKEWSNTDMAQYIRPQTLFGTKFESYLESIPKPKPVEEPKDKPATEADRELISNILARVGNKVWKSFDEN